MHPFLSEQLKITRVTSLIKNPMVFVVVFRDDKDNAIQVTLHLRGDKVDSLARSLDCTIDPVVKEALKFRAIEFVKSRGLYPTQEEKNGK